ncbi:YpiF family protein [Neobacillus jeddahensis]|uniref:YpiF family protein n=1 Tax=Neobacillus jeddahensis TaxID=1461580 RepID=UPI00058DF257|nr:YpiF family protein [Neobacillus jeddahensis]
MKWIPQEVQTTLDAIEYVDTAVIPIYSIAFGGEMKQSAAMVEFITLLTSHLERQFTGRILLFPPFTYLKSEDSEKVLSELIKWEDNIVKSDFKHIVYITSELDWRSHEQSLGGPLLWLPSIPLEDMNDSQKIGLIDSQVKQISTFFTQKWNEN